MLCPFEGCILYKWLSIAFNNMESSNFMRSIQYCYTAQVVYKLFVHTIVRIGWFEAPAVFGRWIPGTTVSNVCYLHNTALNFELAILHPPPSAIHEHNQIYSSLCQWVFHGQLDDKTDKRYFYGILSEMSSKHFSKVGPILRPSVCGYPIPRLCVSW